MRLEGAWLEKAVRRTREELAARQKTKPQGMLVALAKAAPRPPPLESAIRGAAGVRVIAGLMRRTPEGFIDRDLDVREAAGDFARGGAVALMVATEAPNLGGTTDDMVRAREGCGLPILRCDLFVDPYQLAEARSGGASAVWLSAALLPGTALSAMLKSAAELSLEAAVETSDEAGLDRALDAGARIVLLPDDAATAPERFAKVARAGSLSVGRGVCGPDDVRRLVQAGADAVLVTRPLIEAGDRTRAAATYVNLATN